MCPWLNAAPTNISMFRVISVDDTYEDIEEIKVKGTNTLMLADYGITEGSRIIIIQSMEHFKG